MKGNKHHGGSWKVAYADFITSMMALFLVLWLTAQDTKIKDAIERAFNHPFSSLTEQSVGIIPNPEAKATHEEKGKFDSPSAVQLELLRRVTEDLAKLLHQSAEDQGAVKIEMTSDGLRINVFDRARRPVFEPDSSVFTDYGNWAFSTMAWVVARYQNFAVELEGHTEAGTKVVRVDYGPWELTADRANATRRKLLEHGVAESQIFKITGFADTQPIAGGPPTDETNRRVTVQLRIRSGDRLTSGAATNLPPSSPPMSDAFVPFARTANKTTATGETFRLKIVPQSQQAVPFAPVTSPVSQPARGAAHSHEPQISLEREGDRITRIRIQCSCGQSIELNCAY